MDSFEMLAERKRRRGGRTKFFLTRMLGLLAVVVGVLIIRMIIYPLGPGSVSISISGQRQVTVGAAERIKITMHSVHGNPLWTSIDWGDGRKSTNPSKKSAFMFGGPCVQRVQPIDGSTPPPVPHVDVATLPSGQGYIEFIYRYRRPGTYRVTVHADEFIWVCTNQRSPSGSGSFVLHVAAKK